MNLSTFQSIRLGYTHFQVTDLTLIMKNTNPDRKGVVLHRESGGTQSKRRASKHILQITIIATP